MVAAYINDVEDPNSVKGMKDFPGGFNAPDTTWQDNFTVSRRWAEDGIISKDVLQVTDSDAKFKAGMGGCVVQTINNFSTVEAALQQSNPGAELEIFVNDYAIRNKLEGYAQTDYKAWNYLCVPVSAGKDKCDMAMKFMNWIFSSEENHDLFQYGIKGKHWEAAKDEDGKEIEGTVSTVGMESYTFPAYELTWNPNFIKVNSASDPKVMEYMEYMYDSDRYVGILYSGFTFDHTASDAADHRAFQCGSGYVENGDPLVVPRTGRGSHRELAEQARPALRKSVHAERHLGHQKRTDQTAAGIYRRAGLSAFSEKI